MTPDSKSRSAWFVVLVWNYVFPEITIRMWAGDHICETIYAPDTTLHPSNFPAHTVTLQFHSSSPAEPASWLPSTLIPGCPARFLCGSLDLHVRAFLNSAVYAVRLNWRSCLSDITYPQPPSPTSAQFSATSNSALHPMRQTAEKEGETNRLRSSCTLHRRQECCRWHDFGVWKCFHTGWRSRRPNDLYLRLHVGNAGTLNYLQMQVWWNAGDRFTRSATSQSSRHTSRNVKVTKRGKQEEMYPLSKFATNCVKRPLTVMPYLYLFSVFMYFIYLLFYVYFSQYLPMT